MERGRAEDSVLGAALTFLLKNAPEGLFFASK
jgi:hypothetical protein